MFLHLWIVTLLAAPAVLGEMRRPTVIVPHKRVSIRIDRDLECNPTSVFRDGITGIVVILDGRDN